MAGCILHVVGLQFLWRNAGWFRLEAAMVVSHKTVARVCPSSIKIIQSFDHDRATDRDRDRDLTKFQTQPQILTGKSELLNHEHWTLP